MQVCTWVCGNVALIASEKPFSPFTTAIGMSVTPRVHRSQNFAPSVCSIHSPSAPCCRQAHLRHLLCA